jgi:peptidoglycan hydrolase-like protein with peptidoglycan-binding domain
MPDTTDDLSLTETLEAAPELLRTLTAGMAGHDVARLQLDLRRAGFDPGGVDGIYGAKTQAAVASFRNEHGLAEGDGVASDTWAKVIEVAARERHGDLGRAADEIEAQAAELRTRANGLEEQAKAERDAGKPAEAGSLMEDAAEVWIEGASAWDQAAELWIEAAHVIEPFVGASDDGWKAYAKWARATDAARLYAGRARTAFGKAGEDLDAAGSTDHAERIAAARAEARARAAH